MMAADDRPSRRNSCRSTRPVDLQYQLTIQNPLTDQSIRLRRITLCTEGPSAYSLRADGQPFVKQYVEYLTEY